MYVKALTGSERGVTLNNKTIRYKMQDRLFTYSYRTGIPEAPVIGRHMHIYYEFLQLLDGKAMCNVEGREYELSAGDMIITIPYEYHFMKIQENSNYNRQFLQIRSDFVEELRPNILSVLNSKRLECNNRIPSEIFEKYRLGEIFSGIAEYTETPGETTDFMVRLYACQLVIKLTEILKNEFLINDNNSNKHISSIYKYIEGRFTGEINMRELAEAVHLEKSYISRLFKRKTGITVTEYINMRRSILAKNMLLSGGNPNEIYWQCGFREYTTFYRAFKKNVGMSPNAFRKENCAADIHNLKITK